MFARKWSSSNLRFSNGIFLVYKFSSYAICGEKFSMGQGFLQIFLFSPSRTFPQCSVLSFIFLFILPGRKMDDAWEPSKLQRCFVNRGGLDRKLFLIYLVLKGLIKNKSPSWICNINIEVRTNACEGVTLISLIMKFPRLIKGKLFIYRMFIGPCVIVIVEELKTNLMSLVIFISLIICSTCFEH